MPDHISPDGLWRWDGANWVPTQGTPPAGPPPQPQPAPPMPGQQPKKSGGCLKTGLIVIAVLFVLGLIGAALGGGEDAATSNEPAAVETTEAAEEPTGENSEQPAEETPTPTEEAPPAVVSFPGDGIFEVGEDMKAGLYRADGSGYWERLKDAEGTFDSIIANGNASGPMYVQIKKSDAFFSTNNMSDWVLVDADAEGPEATEFGEGMYLVGVDISPGTYKASGSGYWERLKDAEGTFDSIIANGNAEGNAIVTIKSSDKFFESNGMDENWVRSD